MPDSRHYIGAVFIESTKGTTLYNPVVSAQTWKVAVQKMVDQAVRNHKRIKGRSWITKLQIDLSRKSEARRVKQQSPSSL